MRYLIIFYVCLPYFFSESGRAVSKGWGRAPDPREYTVAEVVDKQHNLIDSSSALCTWSRRIIKPRSE